MQPYLVQCQSMFQVHGCQFPSPRNEPQRLCDMPLSLHSHAKHVTKKPSLRPVIIQYWTSWLGTFIRCSAMSSYWCVFRDRHRTHSSAISSEGWLDVDLPVLSQSHGASCNHGDLWIPEVVIKRDYWLWNSTARHSGAAVYLIISFRILLV